MIRAPSYMTTALHVVLDNVDEMLTHVGGGTIVGGDSSYSLTLLGSGEAVTLGNGTDSVIGSLSSSSVTVGNGNDTVSLRGTHNTITVGSGQNSITVNGTTPPPLTTGVAQVTTDTLNLGSGTNMVFLPSSGNTVNAGSGTTTVHAAGGLDNIFAPAASGGSLSIDGFTAASGDMLDLTRILAGAPLAPDLSNLSSYVSFATAADATQPGGIDAILTITGAGGTGVVTLLNTDLTTLSALSGSNMVLPAH